MSDTGARVATPEDPLRRALDVVRRRAWWGVGVAGFVLASTLAMLLLARPVYIAEARLRLGEPPPMTGVSPTSGLLSFLRMGGDPFSNDLELLSSRSLAEEVVRDGLLNVRLNAPRGWHRDSIFASLAQHDTTTRARFRVTWEGDGTVAVEALRPEREDLGRHRVGEPVDIGGVRAAFLPRKEDGPSSVEIRTVPFDEAVRVENNRIRAERTRREANVLEVSYRHHDPEIARSSAEAIVRGFLEMRMRLFERESSETVDSLRAVARGTQEELRKAEEALEAAQRRTGLVGVEPQTEALVERYELAYEALLVARTEQDALRLQLARVDSATDRVDAWTTLVAHPTFLENSAVSGMLGRLTQLSELQAEARSLRSDESREVSTLERQITQLETALRSIVEQYGSGLDERVAELQRQHDELETYLRGLPTQALEVGRRMRDVRVLSEVVVLTEQRLRQEELRLALAFSNVQIIDPPALRYRPVWPRKTLGAAVGMLLAGLSGLAAIVLVERADASVRRAGVLASITGAPVLATPIAGRGAPTLGDAERAALADLAGPHPKLVEVEGAERWSRPVAAAAGLPPDAVVRVVDYAGARAVADARTVLVVAAGRTPEGAVRRVAEHLREAGASIAGTVAVCRSRRDVEAMWR